MTPLTHAEADDHIAGLDYVNMHLEAARLIQNDNPIEDIVYVAAMTAATAQILVSTVTRIIRALEET